MDDLRLRGRADEVVSAHQDERGRGDLAQARDDAPPLRQGAARLGRLRAQHGRRKYAFSEGGVEAAPVQRQQSLYLLPECRLAGHLGLERIELLLGSSLASRVGFDLLSVVEGRGGVNQDQALETFGITQRVL